MSRVVNMPGFEKPKTKATKKKLIKTKSPAKKKAKIGTLGPTIPDFEKELEQYEDSPSDVLTVEKVPKWLPSTFRRWWRNREQEGTSTPKGRSAGVFLIAGMRHLCSAGEVDDFCTVLELAETLPDLTVFEQTRIDDINRLFDYQAPDEDTGYASWSNRVPEEAIEMLVNAKTALVCKPSDLAATCIAFGMIGQAGVSTEASKLAIKSMDGLIAAFDRRRALLERVMTGFEARRPVKL